MFRAIQSTRKKVGARFRAALLLVAALLGAASTANASEFYGLLRERDLTPFGFLRLDMRPAHAVSIEPGNWVLEAELGYQNTWSLSSSVADYLTSQESQGRRKLGPNEVAAIRNLPGESYLIDLEGDSQGLIGREWMAIRVVSSAPALPTLTSCKIKRHTITYCVGILSRCKLATVFSRSSPGERICGR